MLYLGYVLFILMGGTFGLIGAGGSILSMPILIYFIGLNPIIAVSYSFYIVGLVAFFGAFKYFKKGLIDFKDVLYFAIPSSVGVIFSRYFLLPLIPNNIFGLLSKDELLVICFSFFMILSAIITFKKKNYSKENLEISFAKSVFSALFIGLFVGILGAGGGFLIIPALYNFLKLDIKKTVGTSLAVVSMNSFVAVISDFSSQNIIKMETLIPILIFALTGIGIGTFLEAKIKSENIKKVFAIFTLIIAVIMLITTFL
jgi:uncharacterized membrane protein YfcA